MYEQLAKVAVAMLRDSDQPCFAARRDLTWYETQPSRQIPGLRKASAIANCRDQGTCNGIVTLMDSGASVFHEAHWSSGRSH